VVQHQERITPASASPNLIEVFELTTPFGTRPHELLGFASILFGSIFAQLLRLFAASSATTWVRTSDPRCLLQRSAGAQDRRAPVDWQPVRFPERPHPAFAQSAPTSGNRRFLRASGFQPLPVAVSDIVQCRNWADTDDPPRIYETACKPGI
jgi:hypothetical protein